MQACYSGVLYTVCDASSQRGCQNKIRGQTKFGGETILQGALTKCSLCSCVRTSVYPLCVRVSLPVRSQTVDDVETLLKQHGDLEKMLQVQEERLHNFDEHAERLVSGPTEEVDEGDQAAGTT